MNNEKLNLLLEKYENGSCSPEEVSIVENIFRELDNDIPGDYNTYIESEKQISTNLDISSIINIGTDASNIEVLLNKYEQGICTDEESSIVEAFLSEADREEIPSYNLFIDQEKSLLSTINTEEIISNESNLFSTEELLTRFENNNTTDVQSREVEKLLVSSENGLHPVYESFIENERNISIDLDVKELVEKDESKVVSINRGTKTWKSSMRIAAMMIVVFGAIFMMRNSIAGNSEVVYAEVNGVEITDPDEALMYTLAALSKTSKKMKQGTDNMKHLVNMKKASIF